MTRYLHEYYRGAYYYAKVEGDRLMYNYEPISPREWTLLVTGTVRKAWGDIWIRRAARTRSHRYFPTLSGDAMPATVATEKKQPARKLAVWLRRDAA